ncbi:transposase, partial [Streptosporangium canum]|uniref:transposase n=1 Tax=Streptosporangium canum TaxID=324952 RepID=UPI003F4C9C2F
LIEGSRDGRPHFTTPRPLAGETRTPPPWTQPVFLAYACPRGRALIDRRLYLPERTWLADAARCRAAGVPEQAVFATKPALAAQMIAAALEIGIEASWVTGDEVYGQAPRLRRLLEEREVGYVLAIAGNRRVRSGGHRPDRDPDRRAGAERALAPLQRARPDRTPRAA